MVKRKLLAITRLAVEKGLRLPFKQIANRSSFFLAANLFCCSEMVTNILYPKIEVRCHTDVSTSDVIIRQQSF